jgi:hypothetical protein
MAKIEKEVFYKNILFEKFEYCGVFPFSETYKQLDKLCEIVYKKRLHYISGKEISYKVLIDYSKMKNFMYAYRFLKTKNDIYKRLNKLDIVLYDDIIERIMKVDYSRSDYILSILEKYDTDNDEIISNLTQIFDNCLINYEVVSILVDIYIEPLRYIEDLLEVLDNSIGKLNHLTITEKKMIYDYFDDKISEFSRVDYLNDIIFCCEKSENKESKIFDELLNLNTYEYFVCKQFLVCLKNKSENELNKYLNDLVQLKIDNNLTNLLLDFAFIHLQEELILASLDISNKYPLEYYMVNYSLDLEEDERQKINDIIQNSKTKNKKKRKIEEIYGTDQILDTFKKMKI